MMYYIFQVFLGQSLLLYNSTFGTKHGIIMRFHDSLGAFKEDSQGGALYQGNAVHTFQTHESVLFLRLWSW